jgi:hypothetical protein
VAKQPVSKVTATNGKTMMSNRINYEATIEQIFLLAGVPVILTCFFIFLTFVLPLVDSTRAPYFDLTQKISQLAYWLSQSGGKIGSTGDYPSSANFKVIEPCQGIPFLRKNIVK